MCGIGASEDVVKHSPPIVFLLGARVFTRMNRYSRESIRNRCSRVHCCIHYDVRAYPLGVDRITRCYQMLVLTCPYTDSGKRPEGEKAPTLL